MHHLKVFFKGDAFFGTKRVLRTIQTFYGNLSPVLDTNIDRCTSYLDAVSSGIDVQ